MSIKEAASDALFVQDACNLQGVVISFARVLEEIIRPAAREGGHGTDWVNRHPIAILYASKIASLTGCEVGLEFSRAYDAVRALAGEWT